MFRWFAITASSGANASSLLRSHTAHTAYLPLIAMFSTLRARISSSTLATTSTLCDYPSLASPAATSSAASSAFV